MKKEKEDKKIMSYLEFKLMKEMAYESTYGKDEEIRKQYNDYVTKERNKQNDWNINNYWACFNRNLFNQSIEGNRWNNLIK